MITASHFDQLRAIFIPIVGSDVHHVVWEKEGHVKFAAGIYVPPLLESLKSFQDPAFVLDNDYRQLRSMLMPGVIEACYEKIMARSKELAEPFLVIGPIQHLSELKKAFFDEEVVYVRELGGQRNFVRVLIYQQGNIVYRKYNRLFSADRLN